MSITAVSPMDKSKKNSAVTVPSEEESTVMLDAAAKVCIWNDQEFGDGAEICAEGTVYECSFGKWAQTSRGC